ncbi:hypothetical protein DPMN_023738 [Dreissena polymorpha]|uniref:Uncharacterized protein n=1 Tax=Dreissena polymorpha TaxID=45954 RepID=A0A9D4LN92_DREPO|nr:hypothetical protein DPMN_023738 [Dreissena polymorpha]
MYISRLQTVHLYNVVVVPVPVFHRKPPRPRWSTAVAVVHREIDFPITPAREFLSTFLSRQDDAIRHGDITVVHGVSGEIVIFYAGRNHGDAWKKAEIALDVLYMLKSYVL